MRIPACDFRIGTIITPLGVAGGAVDQRQTRRECVAWPGFFRQFATRHLKKPSLVSAFLNGTNFLEKSFQKTNETFDSIEKVV
jgi:hypothetical protein